MRNETPRPCQVCNSPITSGHPMVKSCSAYCATELRKRCEKRRTVADAAKKKPKPLPVVAGSIERQKEIASEYKRGWSINQLARKFGLGYDVIRNALIKQGVERRPASSQRRK